MDKMRVISILMLVLMAGCASDPKAKKSSDKSSADSVYAEPPSLSNENSLPDDIEPVANETNREKAPTHSESSPDGKVLESAIKSGNDEAIYRSSIQALSQNSTDLRALNALGLYHYRKGHWSAAQLMFGKALKQSSSSSDIHNNLGLVFLAQKEKREAIKEFRKALEINPNDSHAAANLGAIYVEEKDYGKALVSLEIAYRKNSKDQQVLNNYAIALTAAGKFSEAQEMYKKAIAQNENNKDVMFNYASLLIERMNQNQDGLDLLSKVKFLGTSPEVRNKINVLENKAKAGLK